MTDVQNDPDRVMHPLRRDRATGEFEQVSWEDAIADIGARLRDTIAAHGRDVGRLVLRQPGRVQLLARALGQGLHRGARLAALLHGLLAGRRQPLRRQRAALRLAALVPIPDLQRTSFLLMVGANPFVSHGSVLTAPQVKDQLHGDRRARRPRRRRRPAPHRDRAALRARRRAPRHRRLAAALDALRALRGGPRRRGVARARDDRLGARARAGARRSRPRRPRRAPGVAADDVRALARDLAARRPRRGLRAHRLLPGPLRHARRVPARRADARDRQPRPRRRRRVRAARRSRSTRSPSRPGLDTYGKVRSRLGDFPDVLGALPASLMARGDDDAGRGPDPRVLHERRQPGALGARTATALEAALEGLDLLRLARLLRQRDQPPRRLRPAGTTWLEREDLPIAFLGFYTTPFVQYSEAVVAPRGEAREEWEIIDAISREIGVAPVRAPGAARCCRSSATG